MKIKCLYCLLIAVLLSGCFTVRLNSSESPKDVLINACNYVINSDGQFIEGYIPKCEFSEGLIGVCTTRENGKCGYIDLKGNLIIDMQYRSTKEFHNDHAIVENHEGKYGIINRKNELTVPFVYDYTITDVNTEKISRQFRGFYIAIIENDGNKLYGVIDANNNIIIPFKERVISTYYHEFDMYYNSKMGYYYNSHTDQRLYEDFQLEKHTKGYCSEEGLIAVTGKQIVNGKMWKEVERIGFINHKGELVIPYEYILSRFAGFSEGLCNVEKTTKFDRFGRDVKSINGYINTKGRMVFTLSETELGDQYYNGLACVVDAQNYKHPMVKFVDHKGRTVVQFEYDLRDPLADYYNGYIRILGSMSYCIINLKGEIVRNIKFEHGD